MRIQNVKSLSDAELRRMLIDCIREALARTLCRDDHHRAKETFNPSPIQFMNECSSCGMITWPGESKEPHA